MRGPGPAHLTELALQVLPLLLQLVCVVDVIVQNVLSQKLLITGVAEMAQVFFVLFDPKSSHLQGRSVDIFFVSLQIKFVFEISLTEVTGGSAHPFVLDEAVELSRALS